MSAQTHLAQIGALVGDPTRANILLALMDGQARTAKELAFLARVGAPTASAHLAKLVDGGLLTAVAQGRHRYYRIASPDIGRMIEVMLGFAGTIAGSAARPLRRAGPADERMRAARTCYDHIAGRLGVAIADAMQGAGHVVLEDGAGRLTSSGHVFLLRLGVDLDEGRSGRILCRPCLDWSERRFHLAGQVGKALCNHCLRLGWVERTRDSRALAITPTGQAAFQTFFGIAACDADPQPAEHRAEATPSPVT
ncbi:ArsR/SmtB family transcription factor [Chelatococcus asaccharovorans]|uniref:ArsR family transcriptional regulator n=1 Tax=Chelatococcus asaccharovorans TaxID=28210 RepID=A0A2V3U5L3_9HYPH|nr:winged helix-turn-helix domain-containing protein [Chelatococcus asaccharovorans]MBS7704094.1 winged helix-turn-helix transcriptional regulator [Chelatococcus asaccharovorans]PXW58260.1 ArsR family transcriptional regulator [Chelatococcus asaccharovorans]